MKRIACFFTLMAALLAGCVTSSSSSETRARPTVSDEAGQVLRVDGESVVLGQATTRPMSREVFTARIAELIAVDRDEDTRELVRLFPDLAEEAILSASPTSPRVYREIAAWLDAQAEPARGGWSALVADRETDPERYAGFQKSRASIWPALRRGAFTEVARLELAPPSDGPTPWPEIDALLLRGTATLAAGRPGDAADDIDAAADLAASWDPRVETRTRLLAALAHKLNGNFEASMDARLSAIGRLRVTEIYDPMILRLMLETTSTPSNTHAGPSPRSVRARLGRVEIQRGSPQAALLAWRAAETESGAEPPTNVLRLCQAEALIALQQDEAAIAMLAGLARTEVRPEALAMLGLVHLRRSQIDTGLAMLREAVESTTAESHPHVYADAGLALISTDEPKTGRSLLDAARAGYQTTEDDAGLRRLLINQLRYAESIGDAQLVTTTRRALAGLR